MPSRMHGTGHLIPDGIANSKSSSAMTSPSKVFTRTSRLPATNKSSGSVSDMLSESFNLSATSFDKDLSSTDILSVDALQAVFRHFRETCDAVPTNEEMTSAEMPENDSPSSVVEEDELVSEHSLDLVDNCQTSDDVTLPPVDSDSTVGADTPARESDDVMDTGILPDLTSSDTYVAANQNDVNEVLFGPKFLGHFNYGFEYEKSWGHEQNDG
jgi:hypothetical protein